ncbi:MAG: glutamate 5-kinase [Candidatus Altiarchaeales archaeon]|nr:glutamate 5-kinase [Candidatus Altiarchaeales archaeon]MBD3416175.1 glutamate 5-kinase [Candidatus Altiarchaeales archaeon]
MRSKPPGRRILLSRGGSLEWQNRPYRPCYHISPRLLKQGIPKWFIAMERRKTLSKAGRIVVKVGTASITDDLVLSDRKVGKIVREIMGLKKDGREVIIVSSGAIAAGIRKMGLEQRPRDLHMLQATAAVGQNELMKAYGKAFNRQGVNVAQILLTRDDFCSRSRYLNIRNTVNTLLKQGTTPIINENDSVGVEEIKVGDNDTLSALVASNLNADLLILMSSMDGLYTRDPVRDRNAIKIDVVDKMTGDIKSIKGKSRLGGVGGIQSKIQAGKIMMDCGIAMAIVDSGMKDVLSRLINGEPVGTVFIPDKRMENKQQWILFSSAAKGFIVVDEGAVRVLSKGKASLLPSGITKVKGIFDRGDLVAVVDGRGREFARGISNFSSDDLAKIRGRQCSEIVKILKRKACKEVINNDNIVLIKR